MTQLTDTFIFDEIDGKEKQYIKDKGKAPEYIELDIYSYLELKRALNIDDFEEVNYYHSYKVIVDAVSTEKTIRFLSAG